MDIITTEPVIQNVQYYFNLIQFQISNVLQAKNVRQF